MDDTNFVLVEGRLTRAPEGKTLQNGTKLCQFSVAVNRSFKREDEWIKETSFFDIETWGKQADLCATHLEKGQFVRVKGRLKQDRWTTDEGKVNSKIKVYAEDIVWGPKAKAAGDPEEPTEKPAVATDEFEDDIPFN